MSRLPVCRLAAIVATTISAAIASAQPKMVVVGISIDDMTADGQTVIGKIYDRPVFEDAVVTYTRGGAIVQIPGAVVGGNEVLRSNDDATAFSLQMDNIDDWGDLNCFDSNYDPDYPEPCPFIPAIAHHWTANTGWVNCGSFPTNEITQDYVCVSGPPVPYTVRVGGTRCDFTINTPSDISGDGRYVIGSGWFQTGAPRDDGCPPFGFCGDFYPFRWDSMTGILEQLPVQPGTTTARVDRTNYDGSVHVGYDLSIAIDPDGPGPIVVDPNNPIRKLVVWRNGVQTILDGYGHRGSPPVNSDGTMIAAQTSEIQTELLYGPPAGAEDLLHYSRLVRWTWDGASYVPQSLGKPALYQGFPAIQMIVTDISDDGNTIIGAVGYGTQDFAPVLTWRTFIWNPAINGGVIADLQDYLRSQVLPGDTTFDNDQMWISYVDHLSADGNTMIINFQTFPEANDCLKPGPNAILYLNGTTCEPPVVELDATAIVYDAPSALQSGVINCRAIGSWPMTFQWQRKDLLTAEWVDIVDDPDPDCVLIFGDYSFQGAKSQQLRMGFDPSVVFPCDALSGDYRCIVSNACGTVTTETAHVTITADTNPNDCFTLPGDMDSDGFVSVFDIPNFVASLLCKPMPDFLQTDRADMNADGIKDGRDIQEFVQAILP